MFSKESLPLLGLAKKDYLVFLALQKGTYSVSALARLTDQSRTSLYPRLQRLHARGLITPTHSGKRTLWRAISSPKLKAKLFSLAHAQEDGEEVGDQMVGIIPSQLSEYKVYVGLKKLVQIYEDLGQLPRHTRLYAIQPNTSAYSVMKRFPFKSLVAINQHIKDRQIIMEVVLQENFLDYYTKRLKKEGKKVKDILEAYGGRLGVTTYVPGDRLNFDSEIMFYNNVVIIANWQDLVAVVIKNEQIAGLMIEFFESLKVLGYRTDQNPRVEELLKNIS
jgi:hypothetical protein